MAGAIRPGALARRTRGRQTRDAIQDQNHSDPRRGRIGGLRTRPLAGGDGAGSAGKIVDTGDGLALMGFLHDGPDGFIGAIADPVPVQLNGTGLFRPIP